MRHRGVIVSAILAALTLPSRAAAEPAAPSEPRRLALGAVVERVLARSPTIEQARERLREAQAGDSEALLSRLPRLTAKSALTRSDDPVYAFSSLLEQRRFGAQNFAIDALNEPGYLTNVRSSLELGLPLFTRFQLTDGRALSRLQVAAAGAGEDASAQGARCQTVEAYLHLLLGEALLENADSRIASATASLDEARRLKARGLVLGSDFYAAEALLDGLRASRIRAQRELAAARSVLDVLSASSGGPIEPLGSLEPAGYSPGPLPALIERAIRERQDLRQAALGASSAAVLARREALSLLPQIEAFAAVQTNTSDFGSNPANRMVGVRAELPLGDPTYFGRKAKAAAARRAAYAGLRSLEEAARIEVGQRYQEYEGAAEALPVLREAVEKAEKSLELFRPLYRAGRQSILDVLRAEDALLKARAGYLEALYQTHAGYARLRLSTGSLDSSAVAEIEDRLGGPK